VQNNSEDSQPRLKRILHIEIIVQTNIEITTDTFLAPNKTETIVGEKSLPETKQNGKYHANVPFEIQITFQTQLLASDRSSRLSSAR